MTLPLQLCQMEHIFVSFYRLGTLSCLYCSINGSNFKQQIISGGYSGKAIGKYSLHVYMYMTLLDKHCMFLFIPCA